MATGVLITGFGGPDSLEAVRPFMCNLMDSEPSDELVDRVCARYLAIGGESPLNEIAASIATGLETELANAGHSIPVAVGMRYWQPFIPDAMAMLKDAGCDRIVTVSLSPFDSKVAHGACRDAVRESAQALGVELTEAPLLSSIPYYADFFAASAAAALTDVEPSDKSLLVFTAHSLPQSDLADGDPYVAGLRDMADQVADKLGLDKGREDAGDPLFSEFRAYGSTTPPRPWFLVYQSKGQRPGAWLEPDLDELIDAAAKTDISAIVVAPIGFVTDHMETLYDLDIVAADRILLADMGYMRAPGPNDEDVFVSAVAQMVIGLL